MDRRRFERAGRLGRWHELVERYTPDGWLGRSLLGSTTGAVGLWLLALAAFEVPRWGLSLAALFWFPALLGFGLPALFLSLTVLWPVYLSLIGNVESAEAYPRSRTDERSTRNGGVPGTGPSPGGGTEERRGPSATPEDADALEPSETDPFGDLKRRYANGDLSEAEFERRIESRLEDGAVPTRSAADRAVGDGRRERVPDRN